MASACASRGGRTQRREYVVLLFVLDGLPYSGAGDARRRQGRAAPPPPIRATLAAGPARQLASLGSYWIALWAMTRAPVAAVSALRETSVLFAAALSVLVLKEPFGLQRAAGTLSSSPV